MCIFKYGMRGRGCSPGAQPKDGFLEREDDPLDEYHDIILYTRPLSESEKTEYELDFLGMRFLPV